MLFSTVEVWSCGVLLFVCKYCLEWGYLNKMIQLLHAFYILSVQIVTFRKQIDV